MRKNQVHLSDQLILTFCKLLFHFPWYRCSEEHEILGADLCEHGIVQLTLVEKLQVTRELIKCGYESPFMEELKAAAAAGEPDFLRSSQARRSSRLMSFNGGLHPMTEIKNGDLSNGVGDGTVSIDIEQNWNLNAPSSARNSLKHRSGERRHSNTSSGRLPPSTPQVQNSFI